MWYPSVYFIKYEQVYIYLFILVQTFVANNVKPSEHWPNQAWLQQRPLLTNHFFQFLLQYLKEVVLKKSYLIGKEKEYEVAT